MLGKEVDILMNGKVEAGEYRQTGTLQILPAVFIYIRLMLLTLKAIILLKQEKWYLLSKEQLSELKKPRFTGAFYFYSINYLTRIILLRAE